MAPKTEGAKVIPLDEQGAPGFWARLRYALTGGKPPTEWFGPGKPIAPVAQEEAHGRRFDYPFATNMMWTPRAEQGENAIDFTTLRRMADPALGGLDLVRLAIETRKDQMATQKWHVRARDSRGDGGPAARKVEKALRKPDLVQPFQQWQRALLEDALVLDAPAIYLRPTKTYGQSIPEIIDGGTLKRLLSMDGRTPLPPEAAFRQQLKGLPATDYTLDEMIYMPRNPRPNRIYGMSPVEQVLGIVSVALRRQIHLLNYYTEGNVPDAFIGVPETWTQGQIEDFQKAWDALLTGNLAERRAAKFVPGGTAITFTKDAKLKDEIDDWLSRIICYAFGLSPQTLVREMNRATAETSKGAAAEEGLEPWKVWFKVVMDDVIERCFGAADLEWSWDDEEIQDPLVKANVAKLLVADAKVIDVDEARVGMYGMEPLTEQQKADRKAAAAPPPGLLAGAAPEGEGDEGGEGAAPPGKQPKNGKPPPGEGDEGNEAKVDGHAIRAFAALVADELKKKSFASRT